MMFEQLTSDAAVLEHHRAVAPRGDVVRSPGRGPAWRRLADRVRAGQGRLERAPRAAAAVITLTDPATVLRAR